MKQQTWLIYSPDEEYLRLLARYAQTGELADSVLIQAFSDLELFLNCCQSNESAGLVVVDAAETKPLDWPGENLQEWCGSLSGKLVFLVEEEGEKGAGNGPNVFKYQPLPQQFAALRSFSLKAGQTAVQAEKTELPKIVSVYSPTGGSGKTTVALHFAKALADRDLRVLYVNLELNAGISGILQIDDTPADHDLIYRLKTDRSKLAAILPEFIRRHDQYRFDYMLPPPFMDEWLEATPSELEDLFKAIQSSAAYDLILLDLDGSFRTAVQAAFECSVTVVWIATNSLQSAEKDERALNWLRRQFQERFDQARQKIRYVLNKQLEANHRADLYERSGLKIEQSFAYEPRWKQISDREQFYSSDAFTMSIGAFSEKWYEEIRDGEHG